MRYSPAQPIARLMVAALMEHDGRYDAITTELETAIASAGVENEQLTLDTLFTVALVLGKRGADLRRVRGNSALHVEATVSQLRRAQAAFIRAHDRYLERYSDLKFTELRWAQLRLTIVQNMYDSLVHGHPSTPRMPKLQAGQGAVREPHLSDFSAAEQAALKHYIADPDEASARLEAIIREGRASGDPIRTLYGAMLDPGQQETINRWLTKELRREFDVRSDATQGPGSVPTELQAQGNASVPAAHPTGQEGPISACWPPIGMLRQDQHMAAELIGKLDQPPPRIVELFFEDNGAMRLTAAPKAQVWQAWFAEAIDHPDVQRRMRQLHAEKARS